MGKEYDTEREVVNSKLDIIRAKIGPAGYVAQEKLYQYGDETLARLSTYLETLLNRDGQLIEPRPRIILHAHFGNSGYFGARASQAYSLPLIFTAHSLARQVQETCCTQERIKCEEMGLKQASVVTALTKGERDHQYKPYASFDINKTIVLRPGVSQEDFSSPDRVKTDFRKFEAKHLRRLRDPARPSILAIARASPRKNLPGLVRAYVHAGMYETHNLVLVMGKWSVLEKMEKKRRAVFAEVLHELGKFRRKSRHCWRGTVVLLRGEWNNSDMIPQLYTWAAARRGLFVNPAFYELFGLTTLEAAVSGLPVLATSNGGPSEVIGDLQNGVLCENVEDVDALAEALKYATSPHRWDQWSRNGIENVVRFSWKRHVEDLLEKIMKNGL
jgi:sucrose-phosphate synthase